MRNIGLTFRELKFKKSQRCNPIPGYKDSCEPCKNCGKKRNYGGEDFPPLPANCELREDDSLELREDDSFELREIFN